MPIASSGPFVASGGRKATPKSGDAAPCGRGNRPEQASQSVVPHSSGVHA
jgi:hypothetical protein